MFTQLCLLLIGLTVLISTPAEGMSITSYSGGLWSVNELELQSARVDTSIATDSEYVLISLTNESYLLLRPGTNIQIKAGQAGYEPHSIQLEINKGSLYIHMIPQSGYGLELMVNGSLVSVSGANAGVHTMGFYWVEEGQLQILSLDSGSQATIRKGMYAQLNEGGNDIISGNLSNDEVKQLADSYRIGLTQSGLKTYQLEITDSDNYVIREVRDGRLNN